MRKTALFLLGLFLVPLFSASQDYQKADSIARSYQGHDLNNLTQLSLDLSKDLATDREKFRALYTWVCLNIEVDYRQFLKVDRQRRKLAKDSLRLAQWNAEYSPKSIARVYKEKEAVCTGYAFLLAQMAETIGIECKIVNGYGRIGNSNVHELSIPNHSWNAVKLEGEWHFCDPTWSSGIIHVNGMLGFFEAQYNPGYFLCPTKYFHLNHFPEDQSWLKDGSFTSEEFTQSPICYRGAFKYGVFPSPGSQLMQSCFKGDTLSFDFDVLGLPPAGSYYIEINNGFSDREMELSWLYTADGKLRCFYQFDKSGIYDVHLKKDNELLCTYSISVSSPD